MIFNIDDEKQLRCDLETLIDTRMLVQGSSGSGKSWLLRHIFEQTHGHVQQIIIDPEGEFASLREKYDYVHAAPSGGDTVANPRSAALLAEKVLELHVSVICDIYELHPYERIRFVKLFLEALVNAPKRLWHETLVVVDEAHTFAPEKGSAESLSAMIGLASLGRKRGFAAIYATQRIQKLHKDACADLVNKLIGRTNLDVDVARAGDELGFGKERRRELIDLTPGTFFASGPAFSARGVTQAKVGGVMTTHPKRGKRIAFAAPPPTAKIKALLPQLSDLPAEAEKKAKTEKELRDEISTLRSELTKLAKAPVLVKGSKAEDIHKINALQKGLAAAMKIIVQITMLESPNMPDMQGVLAAAVNNVRAQFEREIAPRSRQIEKLRAQAEELSARLKQILEEDIVLNVHVSKQEPFVAKPVSTRPHISMPAPRVASSAGTVMPKGQRAILTVLAQSPDGASTRSRLALLAGYAPSGGGFNNYLGALRSSGCIDGSDPIRITNAGRADLGEVEPLPTGEELVQFWMGKLSKAERAILTALVDVYPDPLTKDAIAASAGYEPNGGGFNNALGRLRTIELIEGRGEIRAAAALCEG